jgi:hypothetical protein
MVWITVIQSILKMSMMTPPTVENRDMALQIVVDKGIPLEIHSRVGKVQVVIKDRDKAREMVKVLVVMVMDKGIIDKFTHN